MRQFFYKQPINFVSLMNTKISLSFPRQFHFGSTVFSHGWPSLAPFRLAQKPLALSCPLQLTNGRIVLVTMKGTKGRIPVIDVEHHGKLRAADTGMIERKAATILNLHVDLAPFYSLIRSHSDLGWARTRKAGRFLRSATLFEDIVKMILTTNCTWSLTERMNNRLISELGACEEERQVFPTAAAIADASVSFLRNKVKLGYRSEYVYEFSMRVTRGELRLEEFEHRSSETQDIYKELRSIKGVGDYAASNLLKLLGRFERLGLDSWCRAKFREIHAHAAQIDDSDIAAFYAPFEKWQGLAMWLDLTRQWYFEKFPL